MAPTAPNASPASRRTTLASASQVSWRPVSRFAARAACLSAHARRRPEDLTSSASAWHGLNRTPCLCRPRRLPRPAVCAVGNCSACVPGSGAIATTTCAICNDGFRLFNSKCYPSEPPLHPIKTCGAVPHAPAGRQIRQEGKPEHGHHCAACGRAQHASSGLDRCAWPNLHRRPAGHSHSQPSPQTRGAQRAL